MFMGSSWRAKWSIIKCKLNKCKFGECFMGSWSCCFKMHELFNRILAWKKETSLSVSEFTYLFIFIANLQTSSPPSWKLWIFLTFFDRSCGQIFCADCSEFWAALPDERLYTPVRLCGPCYHAVTTKCQVSLHIRKNDNCSYVNSGRIMWFSIRWNIK